MENYPPTITFDFMGASAPSHPAYGGVPRIEHFQDYRNESISRMRTPYYEWGGINSVYTPRPDVAFCKQSQKYLKFPDPEFTMLDKQRQHEVDDFYIACQMHRDQYRDESGSLHPLDFFKREEYTFQCPNDPTTRYFKYPECYVKYKQPIVLPLTLERCAKTPMLPDRALTGIYNRTSDVKYKS